MALTKIKRAMSESYTLETLVGMILANAPVDLAHAIMISPGGRRDFGDTTDIDLLFGIVKQCDATWASGSNAGALDTGTLDANQTYFVHAIKNVASGVVDALVSASPTNPVLPEGFAARRRLGSFLTDGSGNIRQFLQTGGWFCFLDAIAPATVGLNSVAVGPAKSVQLPVPQGVKVIANFSIRAFGAADTAILSVCDQDLGNATLNDLVLVYGVSGVVTNMTCYTDTSRRINVASDIAGLMDIYTRGWFDGREG